MRVDGPFLRWSNGKFRTARRLSEYFPSKAPDLYIEPFMGSAGVFFFLKSIGWKGEARLYDLNKELVDTYIAVRDNVEGVIERLESYPYDSKFYYELRARRPEKMKIVDRAARMIYLNRNGYNGMYKLNDKGEFVVPFGHRRPNNHLIGDKLRRVSRELQGVHIECKDFVEVLVVEKFKKVDGERTFIYCDPPRVDELEGRIAVDGLVKGFGENDHIYLRDQVVKLGEMGIQVMVSCRDTEWMRWLYEGPFWVNVVEGKRKKGDDYRNKNELVVTTYYPDGGWQ